MEVLEIPISEETRKRVEQEFSRAITKDWPVFESKDGTQPHHKGYKSKLKQIQGFDPVTQVIRPDIIDIVKNHMPEVVAELKKLNSDDPPIILIHNAPIRAPFGQAKDGNFRAQFLPEKAARAKGEMPASKVRDRMPVAECVLMALAGAASLDIDKFDNDNNGRVWSYPTPLKKGKGRNKEEHGSGFVFPFHTDGSMNAQPSEFIMLAAGQAHRRAKTIIVDQKKLAQSIWDYDVEYGSNFYDILQKPYFCHIPGTSSYDTDNALPAPILNLNPPNPNIPFEKKKIFFRGNLAVNKTADGKDAPRIKLSEDIPEEEFAAAKRAIDVYEELVQKPENQITITLKQGDVVFFPNGPHSRTAYREVKDPAAKRFLARFNGKTPGYPERFSDIAVSDESEQGISM